MRTPNAAPSCIQRVEESLFADAPGPVRFFGDLDYAGIQILASLREVFPDTQAWAPGYGAILCRPFLMSEQQYQEFGPLAATANHPCHRMASPPV